MNSFGTCTLVTQFGTKKFWEIICEPHVTTRLKRVFAKLSSASQGIHHLSDTPEMARDLLWFNERYPMEVKPLAYLKRRAAEHVSRERFVRDLLASRADLPPFELAVPLREYQRLAAHLALGTGGLLLADDVGLGKTASAIGTFTDPKVLPAVVVTLAHLPRQWEKEIKRFAPHLKVQILRSTKPYDLRYGHGGPEGACARGRHRMKADAIAAGGASCSVCAMTRDDIYHGRAPRMPDVVVTSYSKLHGWAETLAELARGVVFDEVQELRTGPGEPGNETVKYKAAQKLVEGAVMRLGLSATPIYNYGVEMWHVLNILRPDALGTKGEFTREWTVAGGIIEDPKVFGLHVRKEGLMLRRTRADVSRELPVLQKITHHVDADEAALEIVSTECAELARLILGTGPAEKGLKFRASEELSNKLRQATGIAKAPYVAAFVRLLVESGEKVVLFGWHRAVYDIWLDKLKDLNPLLYTGSESVAEKTRAVEKFTTDPAHKVLVVSLRSGAGLDGLQHVCRTVVFGELDWSPGVLEQCEGRVQRDGQASPVSAYYLLAETGADPIMADVLGIKSEQAEGIRDPDKEITEKLEVDPNHVKKLAEAYLVQRGVPIPEKTPARAEAPTEASA